jgi:hypothetical protein
VAYYICENIKKRVRVASRSLWDTQTDNYASPSFQNQSLWCCAMAFGVYTD